MSVSEREIKSLIGELMDEIDILPTAKAGGFLLRDGNVLPRECSGLH